MNTTHQVKLLNAGFTIYQGENSAQSGLIIKVKTKENHNWKTLEKGFASKAALKRRLHELDVLPMYIDLYDTKNCF